MTTKVLRDKLQRIQRLKGVTFLRYEIGKGAGTHVKIYLAYKGVEFFILTSVAQSSDWLGDRNMMQTVRGAMRAIDTGDPALRAKYLSSH